MTKKPTTIRFEAPPLANRTPRGRAVQKDVVRQLRAHPGEWAIVHYADTRAGAYAMAFQIRRGVLASFRPAGAFEALGRTVDGEYRVYARFVETDGEA